MVAPAAERLIGTERRLGEAVQPWLVALQRRINLIFYNASEARRQICPPNLTFPNQPLKKKSESVMGFSTDSRVSQ